MRDILRIKQEIGKLGIEITDHQAEQFMQYYEILVEWNSFMNLTGITEYEEVLTKHFVDSLQLIKVLDLNKSYDILDLGTGAGFPGIPLKIVFPNLNITLLDSLNKRIKFLQEIITQLGLSDIAAIHGRAEDYGKSKEHREKYDICVSRAVANLATLSEYCIPYVKIGGFFIPYKSGTIAEELENSKKAIKIFGGKIECVKTFSLTDTDIERSLVVIKKEKETPKQYPRSAGKPSKEPIN